MADIAVGNGAPAGIPGYGRVLKSFDVCVYDFALGVYPPRPNATVVRFIGPVAPTSWLDIDEWRLWTGPVVPAAPDDLSGLVQWFKADSLALSDGTAVATWTAAVGGNASQATSGKRPVFKTAIWNGQPVIRFDGSDDVLTFAALGSTLSTYTIVAVARPDVTNAPRLLLSRNSAGYDDDIIIGVDSDDAFTTNTLMSASVHAAATSTRTVVESAAPSIAVPELTVVRYDGSALGIRQGTANETQVLVASAVIKSSGTWAVGANTDSAAYRYWDGDIAEIAIYNRCLSLNEIASMEAHLSGKYGL